MGIASAWYKNLPENEQEEFKTLLRSSRKVLGRVVEILNERMNTIENKESSEAMYETPSWAFHQAHWNGRKAEIENLLQLLAFLEE